MEDWLEEANEFLKNPELGKNGEEKTLLSIINALKNEVQRRDEMLLDAYLQFSYDAGSKRSLMGSTLEDVHEHLKSIGWVDENGQALKR